MNIFEEINLILEDRFHKETNGVLDEKWSKIWECIEMLDNKINMYERIKFCGNLECTIKENFYYGNADGNSDFIENISSEYYIIDEDGDIYLKEGTNVIARYIESTSWVEIIFEDKSSFDLALDNEEDYNDVLKMF
jgi:hypothetical protein